MQTRYQIAVRWCAFCGSVSATTEMNDTVLVDVNIGYCETNNLILDDTFVWYYQSPTYV